MSRRSSLSSDSLSCSSQASTPASASRSTCASVSDSRPSLSSSSLLARAGQLRMHLESSAEHSRTGAVINDQPVAVRDSVGRAFAQFSRINNDGEPRMDSHAFAALCNECGFVDEKLGSHVNLIFARVTRPGFFMDAAQLALAMDLIAKRKGCAVDEIHAALNHVSALSRDLDVLPDFDLEPPQESKRTFDLIEQSIISGDVVLLKGRWLMELCKSGGILPRRQELPETSVWSPSLLMKMVKESHSRQPKQNRIVMAAISCFWLTIKHPDPNGQHLRALCKSIEERFGMEQHGSVEDVAIFWDYSSLPQQPKPSPEQRVSREEIDYCLSKRAIWYSHPKVEVWLLTEDFPGVSTCDKSCTVR